MLNFYKCMVYTVFHLRMIGKARGRMIELLTSERALLLYEVCSIVVLVIANLILSIKIKNKRRENELREEEDEIKQAREVIANKK